MYDFINSFSPGLVLLSYLIAVAGSFVALQLISLAFESRGRQRVQIIALASLALGGVGIWCMHFIGMLAWRSPTMATYDGALTFASMALAVGVVAIGFTLISLRQNTMMVLIAGVISGLGVAGMHFTGMAAMRLRGELVHDYLFVIIAIVIAVVAAAAAFWLALQTRSGLARLGAAFIMGIAVCGMHYTGMAGVSIESTTDAAPLNGYLPPLVLAILTTLVAVMFLVFSGAYFLNRWLSENE